MPRPRAGDWLEDEVSSWLRSGLTVMVSLLEDAEIIELGLEQEAAVCERVGMRFMRFPIPDRGLPASEAAVSNLVRLGRAVANGSGRGHPLPHGYRPFRGIGSVRPDSPWFTVESGLGCGATCAWPFCP